MFQNSQSFFIILYKDKGLSSASLLNQLKKLLNVPKAGFCGTLDPLAEGVLVVALNKATKLISLITDSDKIYSGKMLLGFESASFDTDTELIPSGIDFNIATIDTANIEKQFSGSINQIPPVYSALKVNGVRAYKRARKGETPEMKERPVNIKSLKIFPVSNTELSFWVECSKGTYIRSLVYDIGKFIGCGAVMTELVREKVGDFSIEKSVKIEEIKQNVQSLKKGVITIDSFLSSVNTVEIDQCIYNHLRNGKDITNSAIVLAEGLNYIKYNGEPSFILEKKDKTMSYYAFLRD